MRELHDTTQSPSMSQYRCASGFVPAADLFRLIKCASAVPKRCAIRLRTCCPSDLQTLFYVVFLRGFVPGG